MKKTVIMLAVAAVAPALLGLGVSPARAQESGPDVIDPIFALTLTEAINGRKPAAVLDHFAPGGTVVFDNAVFGTPNTTLTAKEYADRQSAGAPDVPTDTSLAIVDQSMQISAASASWTWRQTSGYLKGVNVDYVDFKVSISSDDHRFKSISIAPAKESLARLVSLAPTVESLVRLPYSPAVPALQFSASGDGAVSIGQASAVMRFEPAGGSQVKGAAIVSGAGDGAEVALHVTGLAAGQPAQAALHAGTPGAPSASFAALPDLAVDAAGTGTATGAVLFRGTEGVEMAAVADGGHHIAISQAGRVVAYGTIPEVDAAANTVGMPRTGRADIQSVMIVLAMLAAGLALTSLRLRRNGA
jgi:hypothetical protein